MGGRGCLTPATNKPEQPLPAFKKGLLGKHTGPKAAFGTNSPTDNFMSPISQKLSGAKQRHFQKWVGASLTAGTSTRVGRGIADRRGGKPNLLASKLSSLAASNVEKEKKEAQ